MSARTVVSLFAGAGGSSMGYILAGYKPRLAVEWDKHAAACYALNFPRTPLYVGDVGALTDAEALRLAELAPGELDVLDGSPPCQGFSTAGARKLTDDRNMLFLEYVRLLRAFKPRAFVMENVPGIALGKMKLVFLEVMKTLREAGYNVRCAVLDASAYGVPQVRKRAIFIGFREDLGITPQFPAQTHTRGRTVAEALSAHREWLLNGDNIQSSSGDPNAPFMMYRLGAYDPRRDARVEDPISVDVRKPSDTVCKTAGGLGNTLHGPAVLAPAYDMVQLTGEDAEHVMSGAAPSPTVVRRGQAAAYKESVGIYALAGQHAGTEISEGAAPSPTVMKESFGGVWNGCVGLAGTLHFSSGMNAKDPPIDLESCAAPTLIRRGIAGSFNDQAQVSLSGFSPMSSVLPAPPLTGKALAVAQKLQQGQRGSQKHDGDWMQYVAKLDHGAPSGTIGKNTAPLIYPTEVRGLSVGEVMRLQSFPDDYRWPDGTTWAQGWARVGNSVPPLMMRAIAACVADNLSDSESPR